MTHPAITAYLDHLRAADKTTTAKTNAGFLGKFTDWLADQDVDLLQVTADTLGRYQVWLATAYRTTEGKRLAASTQGTCISVLKALYGWLHRRGILLFDPAAKLVPAKPPQRLAVAKDHLSLQEAMALVDTLVELVNEAEVGSHLRALRMRDLCAISLALASGRRAQGLCDLHVAHLDPERNEVRVEREKGKTGRVLPLAAWAMAVTVRYLTEARPVLLKDASSPFLLVSERAGRLSERGFAYLLRKAIAETVQRNPDLTNLPHRTIGPHSLRVTFAVAMFAGGCGIRSLNELLMHASLNQTSKYTPLAIEDLRQVLLTKHPRA